MWAPLATLIAVVFSGVFPEKAAELACPVFMSSVLVLGMPHGSVDPLLLFSEKRASRWLALESRVPWIFAYLGVAALFGLVWLVAPLLCLFAFLALTAFHWGTSEYELKDSRKALWLLLGLTRGGLIIFGVLAFQRADSIYVIQLVTGVVPVLPSASVLSSLLVVTAVLHFFALTFSNRMFFHALRYYDFFESEKGNLLKHSHLLSALGLGLVLAVAFFFYSADINFTTISALPAHFMVLAALTLPHAILVTRLQLQHSPVPHESRR